jgi:hypothetical protein
MYWITGLSGFVLYGLNVAAEYVFEKTNKGMDYISDHTDHAREEFRI